LVTALNAEITATNNDVDSLHGRTDSLVTALNAEISATNTDVDSLHGRADSLVTALSSIGDGTTTRIDSLVTALNAEISATNTDVDSLHGRADSLVTALNAEITATNNDVDSLHGRADSLVTALAGEVTRATTREDSIINVLYWNQAVAGTVTLDAGVDSVKMDGVDVNVATLDVEDGAIMNSSRDQAGDILTIYDDGVGNVMTVSSTTGVHISDLTLNDSFTLTGNMSASTYTTTAGDPTNDNELARKAYVDAQIAAEVGAVDAYDYAATASDITNTGGSSLTYYLNGALLLYEDHVAGDQLNANKGYTITVYGDGFAAGQTAVLWCRGSQTDLVTGNNWAAAVDGNSATFTITYNQLVASAGGSQTDGVVRCHLVVDGKNTGLSLKFHLDSTSAAATTASFN
jgi:hypothetical protein